MVGRVAVSGIAQDQSPSFGCAPALDPALESRTSPSGKVPGCSTWRRCIAPSLFNRAQPGAIGGRWAMPIRRDRCGSASPAPVLPRWRGRPHLPLECHAVFRFRSPDCLRSSRHREDLDPDRSSDRRFHTGTRATADGRKHPADKGSTAADDKKYGSPMPWAIVQSFDAVGGPKHSSMNGDGHPQGPTDAGVYLVAFCGRHKSSRYPDWSSVPWGSPLKEDGGALWVEVDNKWQTLSKYTKVTKEAVIHRNANLYGMPVVPKTWVFNDFGHMTCYLFKDHNGNGRRDNGEKVHGEFLHPTPEGEAGTAKGLPFSLGQSHGCIHLKPLDIDAMIASGYLRTGTRVVVHKYSELTTPYKKGPGAAKSPSEVHFYPGLRKLLVLRESRF